MGKTIVVTEDMKQSMEQIMQAARGTSSYFKIKSQLTDYNFPAMETADADKVCEVLARMQSTLAMIEYVESAKKFDNIREAIRSQEEVREENEALEGQEQDCEFELD